MPGVVDVNVDLDPNTGGSAGCAPLPTTKAFAKLGDNADYVQAPGGDFESGSNRWTMRTGAYVGAGNESLGVTRGSRSMFLPLGSSVTSPEFCVDDSHPHFRFVSRPAGALAGYAAIVIYRNAAGKITEAQFTSSRSQSWSPNVWAASPLSPLATEIPLGSGETATVQLKFISTGNTSAPGIKYWGGFALGTIATTQLDSVMVDPYRRG